MPKRNRQRFDDGGLYFKPERSDTCIPTGCHSLDLVLGGGWAEGRVANLVGDKSTGKTLLAIEACANFRRKHPAGRIIYLEAESAFDMAYALHLGIPEDGVELIENLETIEDMYENMVEAIQDCSVPTLYIVDSLDSLSSRAEMKRNIDDGTFGGEKAKKLGELFRRLVKKITSSKMTVIIISQIRDNIGVTFGAKHTRTGGKALDFYASQILWLAKIKNIEKTKNGIKRPVGVEIKAQCKKNKVSKPFRSCNFPILYEYGIENVLACTKWLEENKCLDTAGLTKADLSRLPKKLEAMSLDEYSEYETELKDAVTNNWDRIEEDFSPTRRKYG